MSEFATQDGVIVAELTDTRLTKQLRFIQLRAEGKAYSAIAHELGVSKSLVISWNEGLEQEIADYKAERLQELYEQYGLLKEARIQALGGVLQKVDDELQGRDWSDIPTDKLLDHKLKLTQALASEYVPVKTKSRPILTANGIVEALDDLLGRIQSGEVGKDQAQQELVVLSAMARVYEVVELEDRIAKLERVL